MNYEQNDWSLLQEDVTAPNKWATKTTCIVLNLIWIEITGFDSEDTDNIIPSPALVYNNLKYCLFPVVRWLLKQFDLLVNFSYFYLPIEHSFISLINRSKIFIELFLHFASGGFVSRQHFLLRAWLMMSAVNLKAQLFRLMQRKIHTSRLIFAIDADEALRMTCRPPYESSFTCSEASSFSCLPIFWIASTCSASSSPLWFTDMKCKSGMILSSVGSVLSLETPCFQSYSRNPARGT